LKLTATIKATKQLPQQHVQQAATPYAVAASSAARGGKSSSAQRQSAGSGSITSTNASTISVTDATEQLYAELLHPSDRMSHQWLLGLLARSSSPSPNAEPFDPALCAVFEQWVAEYGSWDTEVSELPLWFPIALMHQGVAGIAGQHVHWLGKGTVDWRYIL
jgi:hypothetical protein